MKHYYYYGLLAVSIFFMPYLKPSDNDSYYDCNINQETHPLGIEEKISINESCKVFINNLVEKAILNNQVSYLSQGLINCYERSLRYEECQNMLVSDLLEALPELLEEFQGHMRAPRPGATHGIAGSPTCDLSEVLLLLQTLQSKINQCCEEQANCCAELIADFEQTFSILTEINQSFSSFNETVAILIEATNTLTSVVIEIVNTATSLVETLSVIQETTATLTIVINDGFNGTFTALNECCSNITNDFNETWTILAALNTTLTAIINNNATTTLINNGFNGTFTALNECCNNITNDFNETWTILRAGFDATFSSLQDIKNTITACCENITREFQETWTILNAGFNGTYSVLDDLKATVSTDFNQTWTQLNQILQNQGCVATIITAAQVGTTGYTINQPGTYILADNILFAPAIAGSSAITINASNVTLDLGCYGITQINATADVNGIEVNAQSNVNILNGSISSMTGDGIFVAAGSSNISVLTVSILTSQRGVVIDGTSGSPTTDYDITGLELLGNTTAITLNFANNGDISDCLVRNSASAGLELVSSYSNKIIGCSIENTGTRNGSVFGVTLNKGGNNIFSKNYIDSLSTLDTFSGNSANAIFIGATENRDIIMDNIISNVTTTSNALPFGIQMSYTFTALSNSLLPTIITTGTLNTIEWSPDGRYVATAVAGTAGSVAVYELTNNVLIMTATIVDSTNPRSLSWSPDTAYLAVADSGVAGGRLTVYSFGGGAFGASYNTTIQSTNYANAISWSPNGKYIAVPLLTNQLNIYEFNPDATTPLTLLATLAGTAGGNTNVALSSHWNPINPTLLALGGNNGGGIGSVTVVQIVGNTINVVSSVTYNFGAFTAAIRWSSDGQRIVVGSFNPGVLGTGIGVYRFNGTTLTNVANFNHGQNVNGVVWSPDNNYVLMGGALSGGIDTRVLNFTGTALNVVSNYTHGSTLNNVSWSPKGDLVVIAGTPNARIVPAEVLSGFIFPSRTQIIGNNVSNVTGPIVRGGVSSGRGISASSGSNLIIQNTAFQNDLNYVFATNIYSQFQANTRSPFPSTIANLSFPPL